MRRKARLPGAYWLYRKHIYITYVHNIWSGSVYPYYEGLPIVPSRHAYVEMRQLRVDGYDVKYILENGYNCSVGRRKKEIIEKCMDFRRKTLKVVVARVPDATFQEIIWRVIHVGKTTKVR